MSEELPEGWAQGYLGDLIWGFEAGRNLLSLGRAASRNECGVLKISAVTWGTFRPEENKALLPDDEPKPHERIRKDDILITRANTSDLVGAVVLVDRDYSNLMLPDKILRIRPRTGVVDPGFLVHALRTPAVREHFSRNATGTSESMRNLSQPKIASAPVAIAPYPEQRRIVAKVEALMAQVSTTRARLARVPLILKRFRQAVLAAAYSGELTKDLRASTASEVEWPMATVDGSCLAIVDCPHKTPKWTSTGLSCLRTTNFSVRGLDVSELRYVSAETYADRILRLEPKPGDIVYSREGGILGIACLIPEGLKACLGQRMMLMRADPAAMRPAFLCYVLNSPPVLAMVREMTGGSASPHLNVGDIKDFPVPRPPLEEQDEIIRRVTALFALAATIEARVALATARADKIPQAILTKAFRGELVPTEADLARAEGRTYEPASDLLARIRAERDAATARPTKPKPGRAPGKRRRPG